MFTHQPRVTEPLPPPRMVSSLRKSLHVPLGSVPAKTASDEPNGSGGAPPGMASGEPMFVGLYDPLGSTPPGGVGTWALASSSNVSVAFWRSADPPTSDISMTVWPTGP